MRRYTLAQAQDPFFGTREPGRLSGVVGSFITTAIPTRPPSTIHRPARAYATWAAPFSGTSRPLRHVGLRAPEISKYLVSPLLTTCISALDNDTVTLIRAFACSARSRKQSPRGDFQFQHSHGKSLEDATRSQIRAFRVIMKKRCFNGAG